MSMPGMDHGMEQGKFPATVALATSIRDSQTTAIGQMRQLLSALGG